MFTGNLLTKCKWVCPPYLHRKRGGGWGTPGICCILRGPQPQQRKQRLLFPTARSNGIKMSLWRAVSSSLSEDIRSKLIWLIQWQTPRAPGLDPFMNGLLLTRQNLSALAWWVMTSRGKRARGSTIPSQAWRETGLFISPPLDSISLPFLLGGLLPIYDFMLCTLALLAERHARKLWQM